jgi:hypothetical protein
MHADGAEDRLRNSCRAMNIESEGDEVIDHILNLLLARSGLHYDNHALSSRNITDGSSILRTNQLCKPAIPATRGSAFYGQI